MSAEVRHKFNSIFIFSQNSRQLWKSNGKGAASRSIDQWFKPPWELCMLRVCLQCLCGLHAAYMFEVCVKCALMLIVCSMCVLKLGISLFVYLFFLLYSCLLLSSNGKEAASRSIDQRFKSPGELCMLKVCLQCLCALHAACMIESCVKFALMLIICDVCVLKLGISLIVYLFILRY